MHHANTLVNRSSHRTCTTLRRGSSEKGEARLEHTNMLNTLKVLSVKVDTNPTGTINVLYTWTNVLVLERIDPPIASVYVDTAEAITAVFEKVLMPCEFRAALRDLFEKGTAGLVYSGHGQYALWEDTPCCRIHYAILAYSKGTQYTWTNSPVPLMRSGTCA